MKKLIMVTIVLAALIMTIGCATTDVKVDKSIITATEENYDFIYEVVNNTSGKLTVATYIMDSNQKEIGTAADVVIEKGELYQFKYNLKNLKKLYGSNSWMGCYFAPENKWRCNGWMNDLNCINQKHSVIVTDAKDPNYCMDGVNSWDFISISELIQDEDDYDFIYEIVNNTSGKMIVSNYIQNYSTNTFLAKTDNVVLEKGESHQFKYKMTDIKAQFKGSDIFMGAFFEPEGKWRCWGWNNDFNQRGKKHTVICTDADAQHCMNGDNKWSSL